MSVFSPTHSSRSKLVSASASSRGLSFVSSPRIAPRSIFRSLDLDGRRRVRQRVRRLVLREQRRQRRVQQPVVRHVGLRVLLGQRGERHRLRRGGRERRLEIEGRQGGAELLLEPLGDQVLQEPAPRRDLDVGVPPVAKRRQPARVQRRHHVPGQHRPHRRQHRGEAEPAVQRVVEREVHQVLQRVLRAGRGVRDVVRPEAREPDVLEAGPVVPVDEEADVLRRPGGAQASLVAGRALDLHHGLEAAKLRLVADAAELLPGRDPGELELRPARRIRRAGAREAALRVVSSSTVGSSVMCASS